MSRAVMSWSQSPGCCGFRGVFWVQRDFSVFFFCSIFLFFFERTRPAASMRPSCLIYFSTSTRVRTGCHYVISLFVSVRLPVCVCVTFVVFTDCKSCTKPISTHPGSMEACEVTGRRHRVSSLVITHFLKSHRRRSRETALLIPPEP